MSSNVSLGEKVVTSSPEHATMIENTSLLIDTVKQDPSEIGNRLIDKGYIPDSLREKLRMDFLGSSEKAEKIVDQITALVDGDPTVYHKFVGVLDNQGRWASECVEGLKESFENNTKQDLDRSHSQPNDSCDEEAFHSASEESDVPRKKALVGPVEKHNEPGFVCPTCQKCTIREYLRDGCPKSGLSRASGKSEVSFPYLKLSNVSIKDKETLEYQLYSKFEEMQDAFVDLQLELARSLSTQNVPTKEVIFILQTKVKFAENELSKACNFIDIFGVLQSHISFFNYEIVERVVNKFGSTDDKTMFGEYVKKFEAYCERSVFEVPPTKFHPPLEEDESSCFALKYMQDSDTPIALNKVKAVCRKIAEILGIDIWSLCLLSIEEGCILLTFAIPKRIADSVLPISLPRQRALSEIDLKIPGDDSQQDVDQSSILNEARVSPLTSLKEHPSLRMPPEPRLRSKSLDYSKSTREVEVLRRKCDMQEIEIADLRLTVARLSDMLTIGLSAELSSYESSVQLSNDPEYNVQLPFTDHDFLRLGDSKHYTAYTAYTAYKKLIVDISDLLSPDDLLRLAYINDVRLQQTQYTSAIYVLQLLEWRGIFGMLKLEELIKQMEMIHRHDLASKIEDFERDIEQKNKGEEQPREILEKQPREILEKQPREIFEKYRPELLQYMNITLLLPHLLKSSLLTEAEFDHLQHEHSYHKKVNFLFSAISKRGKTGFDRFVQCLEDTAKEHIGHEELAHLLKEASVSS